MPTQPLHSLRRLAFCGGVLATAVASFAADDTEVSQTNGQPIARIKESIICCPKEEVYLDGWASIDVGGDVSKWRWDLNADGTPDTTVETGELIIAAPRKSSSYAVILTVVDNEGNISAPDTAMVHVMDIAPTVTMRSDTTVKVGVRVNFQPVVRWVCSEPTHFEWDFDNDGTTEYRSRSNGNTSKVYYTPGRYRARFSVVDAYGREGGILTTVHVVGTHLDADETASASEPPAERRRPASLDNFN